MARFPFGVPNSWYVVAYSDEVVPGAVQRLRYFDRDLVLFRGESGSVAVLDAYCPHLGAHLGVGGKVVGDTLQCPFHGWRWDAAGACKEIPYAKRIPPKVRAEHYPVIERNGMIFVWYHAEGEAPSFEIPEVEGWGSDGWLGSWLRWEWTVKTHPQEMAENGIDWPHFERVHGFPVPDDRSCEFRPNSFLWQVGGSKNVSTLGGQPDDRECYDEDDKVDYDKIRDKPFYQEGIGRLRQVWQNQLRVVLMCSEGKPEMCHRSKLIGQTLVVDGGSVMH